jgi:16S rRNA (cytosine967-C5)-methyltransferase
VNEASRDLKHGLAARKAALNLFQAALNRRGGLDEGIEGAGLAGLDGRDRAFARMLGMTVLRRLGAIDQGLDARLQKAPPPAVRDLLRLGLAQVRYMNVPAFAAVSATLDLAQADKDARPFKGLMNAVLRRLSEAAPTEDAPEALVPPWMWARWRSAYGDQAGAIAALIAAEPPTDITLKVQALAADLTGPLEAQTLSGGGLRVGLRGEISGWPGFAAGSWWVQDAAAAIPARLLDLKPGQTALDLCAAPGGKTLQLAAAGATVTALDRSVSRLRRVRENLARTGLKAEIVAADALEWKDARTFDAVLLDAPCSATGTFRRHPETLWLARPGDLAQVATLQKRLLDAAAQRVSPGGQLVYCVCSLEPEEGEAQAEGFLKRHPEFTAAPVRPGEGGAPAASLNADGNLRILPSHMDGGMDGFFAARFTATPEPQGLSEQAAQG